MDLQIDESNRDVITLKAHDFYSFDKKGIKVRFKPRHQKY